MTTSDLINMVIAVFTGFSTLFAGLSIVVAISAYRKAREDDFLKSFRLSLLSFREHVFHIDRCLSEPYFCSIARRIVDNIRRNVPDDSKVEGLVAYLKNTENHNHIAVAIHLGRLDSPVQRDIEESISHIQRQPYVFRERFPVLFRVLRALSSYHIQSGRGLFSPGLFNTTLGDPEAIAEVAEPEIRKRNMLEEAYCELEDYVASAPAQMLRHTQPVYDKAKDLVVLLTDHYLKLGDSDLRRLSKEERAKEREAGLIDKPTEVEDAYELLCLIREEFTVSEWDHIVEHKTVLHRLAHTDHKSDSARG